MSEIKSTRELPDGFNGFFTIDCEGFPRFPKGSFGGIEVIVNPGNTEILSVCVGGFRMSTRRSTWAAVVGALVDIIGAENIEISVPAKTFRIEFDDTNLEAKVVAQ